MSTKPFDQILKKNLRYAGIFTVIICLVAVITRKVEMGSLDDFLGRIYLFYIGFLLTWAIIYFLKLLFRKIFHKESGKILMAFLAIIYLLALICANIAVIVLCCFKFPTL